MKTINRKSIEIVNGHKRAQQRLFVTVSDCSVFFSAAIVRMCGIQKDQYVHFMNDGNQWDFYVNDDPDGFKFTFKRGHREELKITNTALCKMILKSFGHAAGKRFGVHNTNRFLDNNPVFRLDDTVNFSSTR
jgi:hypothetical protein